MTRRWGMYPEDLRYSTEHEWARLEGDRVRVGITKFAADRLSDIVFVELPPVGTEVEFMKPFGVVESVKAVSDLYAPVSGKVVEVNEALKDHPEVLNQDPYGAGWLVVIEPADPSELQKLLGRDEYLKLIEEA